MAECPKCKKELTELVNTQSGIGRWNLSLQEDGTTSYEWEDFQACDGDNYWSCPECGEVLFYNEEEAINFLKGGALGKKRKNA